MEAGEFGRYGGGVTARKKDKGSKSMPNRKQTSPRVATKASEILRDQRSSSKEKSVAASDLAQARGKPTKKK